MKYAKYKPTGIAWLPEVPEEWEMVLNQFLFKENIRVPSADDIPLLLSQADGLLPTDDMKEKSLKTSTYDGWKRVLVDDLVLNRFKAHLGVFFASRYEGMVSFHYGVFAKRRELLPRYYEYLFHTPQYRFVYSWASKGMTVGLQNLSNTDFYKIWSPLPPVTSQRAIVAFLDEKCGKVDRLVAAKEKEVALLKELKQSMIAEAVTRGVSATANAENAKGAKTRKDSLCSSADSAFFASAPAGNPSRRFVQTGVFWQPEMPEGWSVKKCRYALKKLNRCRPQGAELLVCTNKGTVNKRGDAKIGLVSEDETIYQGVAVGDLLIHGMDTWHGAIAVSSFDGMCTPVVHVCDSTENKKYIAYCFQNMARGKLFKLISNGVRQNTSDFRSWEKVAQLPLVLPPRNEQDRIVAHIEARAAKIDAAVSGLEPEIAALKEYKQRLIADVVTGQRRVA